MIQAGRRFILALGFLTRLPVPDLRWEEANLTGTVVFFPLVGTLLGILLAGAAWIFGPAFLHLPPAVAGAAVVTIWVLLTGGLHLDGLMDTADGLGSRRPREEALEIMKDSRVGAMGVIAAVLILLWKFALLSALLSSGHSLFGPLVLAASWSRWSMAGALLLFPYARHEGMGGHFRAADPVKNRRVLVGATVAVLASTLAVWMAPTPTPLFLPLAIPVLAALLLFWLGRAWTHRLGGLTGDTYGALNEVSETLLLLVGVMVA